MVKKQLQVFHFGNDSIIPFPQITIKNNIGNRNIWNYIFVIPKEYKDWIALSYIVGIPKGCFFFLPGLLMKTLLRGLALYPLPVRLRTAFILEVEVNHFSPSIPDVLFPLFRVTLLTVLLQKIWLFYKTSEKHHK